jgi:glycogen operon protein
MRRVWLTGLALAAATGCPSAHAPVGDDVVVPDGAVPFEPPLGGSFEPDGSALHFRLAAPRATRVEAWIYAEPLGAAEVIRVELAAGGDGVWAARVATDEVRAAGVDTVYYGYRVWGPSWVWDEAWQPGSEAGFVARVTADGDRMNPNKLLIDPYARELSHDPVDARLNRTDEEYRAADNAAVAPKSIVLPHELLAGDVGPRPERDLRDDVIYEVHLRGLTAGDAADPCRGTYAAAAARADYLADLGVTAIELLPVQETWNDGNDSDPNSASGDNYWGYSTLAFFAPDRRYACDRSPGGPTLEFREMVAAFHQRGLKVLIDVVYNHTAEGGGGSLLSWRGIDNAAYYHLDDAGTGFVDRTGIGANTNAVSPVFRDLVIDSLRTWHDDLGVDGFRWDLAPILGNACERGCFRYDPEAPGNVLVRAVEELPGAAMIAEPWGIGAGSYQVGNFPAGWSEWNDRYRDTIRQDVNLVGVADVTLGWLANRLAGSPELFGDDGRPPAASVNYVVSHDGFTLRDVHACNGKNNNQAWPYGPSGGGTDANYSWDHGGNASRQRQAARTSLALLLLSSGVPMITGGDEMLRTQRCNNNPYNLDSVATWIDWTDLGEQAAFHTFASRLLAFRHAHPGLRPASWHDDDTIGWHGAGGAPLPDGAFDDPGQHFLGMKVADPGGAIYLAYNGSTAAVAATLPPPAAGTSWWRVADTGAWMEPEDNIHAAGAEVRIGGNRYDVAARSLALFIER